MKYKKVKIFCYYGNKFKEKRIEAWFFDYYQIFIFLSPLIFKLLLFTYKVD